MLPLASFRNSPVCVPLTPKLPLGAKPSSPVGVPPTVTTVVAVSVPLLLVAVNVYVVVAVGFTVTLVPVTVPILLSIVRLVGTPVMVQLSCDPVPAAMLAGFAVKLVICGAPPLLPLLPPETPGQAVKRTVSAANSRSGANLKALRVFTCVFACIFPPKYWGQPALRVAG